MTISFKTLLLGDKVKCLTREGSDFRRTPYSKIWDSFCVYRVLYAVMSSFVCFIMANSFTQIISPLHRYPFQIHLFNESHVDFRTTYWVSRLWPDSIAMVWYYIIITKNISISSTGQSTVHITDNIHSIGRNPDTECYTQKTSYFST